MKTKLSKKKWTMKRNNGGFFSDLTDKQLAEANKRHDEEMKKIGHGFYEMVKRSLRSSVAPSLIFALSNFLSLKAEGATSASNVRAEGDLKRIAMIESSGNPAAIGDGGKARGLYQMHQAAWQDACRSLGKSWAFSEATNSAKATVIAAHHLGSLNRQFEKAKGRSANFAESYAMWNLGFQGFARRNFDLAQCPQVTRAAVLKGK